MKYQVLKMNNLFNNKGVIFRHKGELDKALELFKRCLSIKEKIGEKRGIGESGKKKGEI